MEETTQKFNVLMVCTGNICRSPLAEYMFRNNIHNTSCVVRSAGTHALSGKPMTDANQRIAQSEGIYGTEHHVAKQLLLQDIQANQLILGMSRKNRQTIVELAPSAINKTFTLREFAMICNSEIFESMISKGSNSTNPLLTRLEIASSLRGMVIRPGNQSFYDVIDPYKQKNKVYQQQKREIADAIGGLSRFFHSEG